MALILKTEIETKKAQTDFKKAIGQFEQELKRLQKQTGRTSDKVSRDFIAVNNSVKRSFESAEEDAKKAFGVIGRASAENARKIETALEKALDSSARDFDRFSRKAKQDFLGVEDVASKSLNTISRVSSENARKIESSFDRALDNSGRDFDRFSRKAKGEFREIQKAGNKTSDQIKDDFSQLAGTLGGLGLGAGVAYLGKEIVQLGSDVEEIGSRFDVVFKGVEGAGEQFDALAEKVGRSRLEIKRAAGGLGDILQPLGFTRKEAAALSASLAELAIDRASFANAADADVLYAFTAALTGEREALATYGIKLLDADIKNKAYTTGLAKTGKALSGTQTALATYELLLEKTSNSQGDTTLTAGSYANQLKRLQGNLTDLGASMGQVVVGPFADFISGINDILKAGEGLSVFSLSVEYGITSILELTGRSDLAAERMERLRKVSMNVRNEMELQGRSAENQEKAWKAYVEVMGEAAKESESTFKAFAEENVSGVLNEKEIQEAWDRFGEYGKSALDVYVADVKDAAKRGKAGFKDFVDAFGDDMFTEKQIEKIWARFGDSAVKASNKATEALKPQLTESEKLIAAARKRASEEESIAEKLKKQQKAEKEAATAKIISAKVAQGIRKIDINQLKTMTRILQDQALEDKKREIRKAGGGNKVIKERIALLEKETQELRRQDGIYKRTIKKQKLGLSSMKKVIPVQAEINQQQNELAEIINSRVNVEFSAFVDQTFNAKSLLEKILVDLGKAAVSKGLQKLLGLSQGNSKSSGPELSESVGDLLTLIPGVGSAIGTGVKVLGGLFGFADGGMGQIRGNPGIDNNVLSLNGQPFAKVSDKEYMQFIPQREINNNRTVNNQGTNIGNVTINTNLSELQVQRALIPMLNKMARKGKNDLLSNRLV